MPDQDNQQQPQGQTAQITGTVQIQPQGGGQQQGKPAEPKPEEKPEEKPKSGRKFIVIAVVILLVLGAGFWYYRSTFSEDTDDAQVDATSTRSARASRAR